MFFNTWSRTNRTINNVLTVSKFGVKGYLDDINSSDGMNSSFDTIYLSYITIKYYFRTRRTSTSLLFLMQSNYVIRTQWFKITAVKVTEILKGIFHCYILTYLYFKMIFE